MPLEPQAAQKLIRRRHPEWVEHQRGWRWLADSYEGGDRYRYADYTSDPTDTTLSAAATPWFRTGTGAGAGAASVDLAAASLSYNQVVDRNLAPHRREMTREGRDLYALRLARTPVPEILARTVEVHLSKVYAKEVRRSGPAALEDWWADVDGRGAGVERWAEETLAPLLLVLGQLDLVAEHPAAPKGARIETRADQLAAGVTGAVVRVVLPENLVWWELGPRGDYAQAVVLERLPDGAAYWRHWTDTSSDCYTAEGGWVADRSYAHRFGRVPMVRVFDRRKPRCENVGRPRWQEVAELQRAVYNTTSELILSDVQQSHARLQLPEDLISDAGEIASGPDAILPMRKLIGPNGQVSGYQGASFLDPPKAAQAEIRAHVKDWQDQADRAGSLLKPAGMVSGSTTGQSGVSKMADQTDANAVLTRVAEVLEGAETQLAQLVLRVLSDGPPRAADLDAVRVEYPHQFDLFGAEDAASVLDAVQRGAAQAGALPLTESALLARLVTLSLPGLDEDEAAAVRAELAAFAAESAQRWATPPPTPDPPMINQGATGNAKTEMETETEL